MSKATIHVPSGATLDLRGARVSEATVGVESVTVLREDDVLAVAR